MELCSLEGMLFWLLLAGEVETLNEVCGEVPYNFQFTALTLIVISLERIISHRGEVWEVIYMT